MRTVTAKPKMRAKKSDSTVSPSLLLKKKTLRFFYVRKKLPLLD